MKSHRIVLGVFVLSLLPLMAAVRGGPAPAAVVPAQAPTQPAVKEITITAKKYAFEPNKIDVALNTVVRFTITAVDTEHGFEIEGVKGCTSIPKGETKTVEYKADKAGTFNFKCCHFCGMGHGKMKGTVTVK